VLAAVGLSLVAYVGRSTRWQRLLARSGVHLGNAASYRLTLLGILYGMVTPGRVGEFARVLHISAPRTPLFASVIWDRLADVLLLEVMSLPAFLLIPGLRGPLLVIYVGMVAITGAAALVLNRSTVLDRVGRLTPSLAARIEPFTSASSGTFGSAAFRAGLGDSLFFYVLSYASAWLLLRDLAPRAPVVLAFTFPVIPLLGNLPLAFGGLGLREQVSLEVFRQLGVGAGVGPIFSLTWFATTTVLPGLVGLVLAPSRWAPMATASAPVHRP